MRDVERAISRSSAFRPVDVGVEISALSFRARHGTGAQVVDRDMLSRFIVVHLESRETEKWVWPGRLASMDIWELVQLLRSFSVLSPCRPGGKQLMHADDCGLLLLMLHYNVSVLGLCCYALLPSRHLSKPSSHEPPVPSHLSVMMPQVRALTMPSTAFSFRRIAANCSVRDSRGKNRPEYGSRRSLTILSASFLFKVSRWIKSGSSGSGDVATEVQYDITSDREFQEGKRTDSRKTLEVSRGMGWRVNEEGRA